MQVPGAGEEDLRRLQRSDLAALGHTLLTLACAGLGASPSLDLLPGSTPPDLVRVIAGLLASAQGAWRRRVVLCVFCVGAECMWQWGCDFRCRTRCACQQRSRWECILGQGCPPTQDPSNPFFPPPSLSTGGGFQDTSALAGALATHTLGALSSAAARGDAMRAELAKECENGRLLRLLARLGTVAGRPSLGGDTEWAETGDRCVRGKGGRGGGARGWRQGVPGPRLMREPAGRTRCSPRQQPRPVRSLEVPLIWCRARVAPGNWTSCSMATTGTCLSPWITNQPPQVYAEALLLLPTAPSGRGGSAHPGLGGAGGVPQQAGRWGAGIGGMGVDLGRVAVLRPAW